MLAVAAETETPCGADIVRDASGVSAGYEGLKLTGHFQPIFSLSHCRAIGHEDLLRAADADLNPVAPGEIIAGTPDYEDLRYLDQLCRYLHATNHSARDTHGG
jgi:EAL domain-containing protein (putative c-di-GMP-specific phosphodiesterase class I)